VGDATSSLGDAKSSLGDAKSFVCDAEISLGDAKSSLGDAKSFVCDAEISLGDVWQWAAVSASQRAFHIPELNTLALCPGLDSINHRAHWERVALERPSGSGGAMASARATSAQLSLSASAGYTANDQVILTLPLI
jgi:hypothetical protein